MQALNVIDHPRFEGDKATKVSAVKTTQINVDALFLKAGQSHGPYRLPDRDRVVVVISGRGELVMQGAPVEERIELKPGTIALAPRNTWHAIVTAGSESLVVALAAEFPERVEERG